MNFVSINCSFCGKRYKKDINHFNENTKLGHRNFCSLRCLAESRLNRKILICENSSCGKKLERTPSSISRNNYCSHSCAAIVSNIRHPRNPGVVKKCAFCGKDFKSRKKYCSRPCKDKGSTIPAEELISKIKTFVKKNGRIPLKREMVNYHATRSRFGSWNNAIKAAGFDPNPVMFANKHIAKDGHKCDSLAEKIIDDWLYAGKIAHERSIHYPGNDGLTSDFLLGDYWIEFFGLYGEHKRYDELREKKLKIAKKYRLKLIGIYPEDLFPKNRLLERFRFLKL